MVLPPSGDDDKFCPFNLFDACTRRILPVVLVFQTAMLVGDGVAKKPTLVGRKCVGGASEYMDVLERDGVVELAIVLMRRTQTVTHAPSVIGTKESLRAD
jgi:hypothetical protein